MKKRLFAVLTLCVGLGAVPALAQEFDIDAEGGLLEQGLIEKKEAPKPVLADPDEKLRDKVDKARMDLEKRLNEMQTKGQTFLDFTEALEPLVARMLKANDAYLQQNRKLVDQYRKAVEAGKDKDKASLGKQAVSLRDKHLKALAKLDREADKLEAKLEKLRAKAAKEEAEAEPEGEGDDEGEE